MSNGVFAQKIAFFLLFSLALNIGWFCPALAESNRPFPPLLEGASSNQLDGLFILDYQNIRLPDSGEIDLIGYHILSPINNWAYVGFDGYAPFSKGESGGFMAFGLLAHAQKQISERLFATAGLSFGGGGGGKSVAESVALSGTGGFVREYLGFGYKLKNFSVGVNVSHMAFFNSAINNTQINFFLQKPFSYAMGDYSMSGRHFSSLPRTGHNGRGSMISFGLDNYFQIDPVGSYKGAINAFDIQFSRFLSGNTYWYYALGVGYKGLPIYNQVIAGVGARFALSNRIRLYGQVGLGSGGYAPSIIDTGSGLLFYPKLSFEYLLKNNTGIALTTGYVMALDGTAKNVTFGVALNHYFSSANAPEGTFAPSLGRYDGYRFSISNETVFNLSFDSVPLDNLNMIAFQIDKLVSAHIYIPLRAAISYQAYRGYPGYGEISAGIGFQNSYMAGDKFQYFGEVQVGANVQGAIARAIIGLDYSLRDGLALRASIGQTRGSTGYQATHLGLGLTGRFSLPNI